MLRSKLPPYRSAHPAFGFCMRIPAREKRHAAGRANTVLSERIGKQGAPGGQRVDMRRLCDRIAKGANRIDAQLVRDEENEVGSHRAGMLLDLGL